MAQMAMKVSSSRDKKVVTMIITKSGEKGKVSEKPPRIETGNLSWAHPWCSVSLLPLLPILT